MQPLRNSHQASKGVLNFWSLDAPSIARGDTGLFPEAVLPNDFDQHCLMRAIKPIELLVLVSFTHYCASTPSLSTWWSSTALKGELVLKGASRLDAFSGYPVRT